MALGTDPWNTNRYMFAGGNPITGVEFDGHYAILENGDQARYWDVWNERLTPPLTRPPTKSSWSIPNGEWLRPLGRTTRSRVGRSKIPVIRTDTQI